MYKRKVLLNQLFRTIFTHEHVDITLQHDYNKKKLFLNSDLTKKLPLSWKFVKQIKRTIIFFEYYTVLYCYKSSVPVGWFGCYKNGHSTVLGTVKWAEVGGERGGSTTVHNKRILISLMWLTSTKHCYLSKRNVFKRTSTVSWRSWYTILQLTFQSF